MRAVACLRVVFDGTHTALSPEALGPLVSKFTHAYLETRWLWPRQFESLTHYAFLLTDSRAEEMDVRELARLSDELQIKLFGTGSDGEVALLLFEGSPEAATEFAHLDAETLAAAISDPTGLPARGRLTRIVSPDAVNKPPEVLHGWTTKTQAADTPDAEAARDDKAPLPALEGAQGIYFTSRGLFVGDVVSSTPGRERTHLTILEGADHMPSDASVFDADCVIAAMKYLTDGARAMLFLPVCYSNIIRVTEAAAYERILSVLPHSHYKQLAASVYDTPRDPAFRALSQLRAILSKYVASIDLHVTDPGFEIEKLAPKAVNSVTLVLPDADARARIAILRRFTEHIELYKRRQIWPGVTNLRSRQELDMCVAAKVPFVTGAAVCRMQTAPIGGHILPLERLPVLAA